MRDEFLNKTLFTSLAHARETVAAWAEYYNDERPHSSLSYATPAAYAAELRLAASQPLATSPTMATTHAAFWSPLDEEPGSRQNWKTWEWNANAFDIPRPAPVPYCRFHARAKPV